MISSVEQYESSKQIADYWKTVLMMTLFVEKIFVNNKELCYLEVCRGVIKEF